MGSAQTNSTVATPTFSPVGGTYSTPQTVSISSTTTGASIRYTTDGVTTPTETVGTLYSGSISVSTTTTIKAIAYKTAMTDSSVATAVYTITGPAWYSTSWSSRKSITVNSGQVTGTLTNFPVLYSVTDSSLIGNTQSNGNDILFTASDGVTKLNHEIESFNSSTGTLVAWVQSPTLATGTVLYVYYGNPAATNQQNATGVWDTHYKAVWHLNSGSPSLDSTSNGYSVVLGASDAYVGGQMASGLNYNGLSTGASASIGSGTGLDFTSTSTPTWSFWLKTSTAANARLVEEVRTGGWGIEYTTTGTLSLVSGSHGSVVSWASQISTDGTWHYFTIAYDGTNASLYKDGALVSANAYTDGWTSAASTLVVNGDTTEPTFADADEIRVSNSVRTAAWVAAEYKNQSSPGTFHTVGTTQNSGSTVSITVTSSPTGLLLSAGGASCTAPCTFQWIPGSAQTIAVTTTPQVGATGTQYVYSSWSDGLAQSHSITVPSSATIYTANFTTQYYLTTLTGTGGSISPASEWVNSGGVVSVSASTTSGYTFSGFTGALTGTTTPQNVTMTAAKAVTANFSFTTGSTVSTSYTYDVWNNLSGVSMTRGSTTQTRTFVYSGPYLQSATNPENGTVSYTYNTTNNKVATKTDQKNQVIKYTYDSLARLTEVQRYPTGLSNPEDTCQQEQYFYDTNPFDSTYSGAYAAGRLTAVEYFGGSPTSGGASNCDTAFVEMYNYSQPGGKIGKRLRLTRTLAIGSGSPAPANLDFNSTYTYDTEGRMTAEQYPNSGPSWAPVTGPDLGSAFDSMGRFNTMTDLGSSTTIISAATYGPSNEMKTMTGLVGETRTYNSMLQLTGLSVSAGGVTTVNITYGYSASQNNGKITSQTDVISGEAVTYAYDALNRLASASATGGSGAWGQSYAYDGFGNLTTQTVTAGSAPAFSTSYDQATNHGSSVDANGNNTSPVDGAGHGFVYDVENRAVTVNALTPSFRYSYAPGNRRVWRGLYNTSGAITTDEVTFWGVTGQKLAVYQLTYVNTTTPPTVANWVWYSTQTSTNYYFGKKLIKNGNGYIGADRLGSIGKYYPYGQERPSATTNGTEKFTGYFRDSETGLDYATDRYHSPGTGRFLTVDRGSPRPNDPGSWNRYAYVIGDPINGKDPIGRDTCEADGVFYKTCPEDVGGGGCVAYDPFSPVPIDPTTCNDPIELPIEPPPPPPDVVPCSSIFVPQLTNAPHADVLYRVLNENSYGLGAKDLSQEDLYIVSVLQNRATSTSGAGNLGNGQNSGSIDNQAKYAGNPSSTNYNYANLSQLIGAKYNLSADSPDCQSFLQDISTAQQAISQVLSTGSVNKSVFYWYTKGFTHLPSYVGGLITTINNTSFYGLP